MVANLMRTRSRSNSSLHILKATDSIMHINDVLENTVNEVLIRLNDDFKKELQSDGDWSKIAKYASVSMDGTTLKVAVDHPTAMVLEYGTPTQPMNPKIRPFTIEASRNLAEALSKASKKALG